MAAIETSRGKVGFVEQGGGDRTPIIFLHGVGSDKRDYMPLIFDAASLDAMCAVRRVFDPLERANPGKVLPMHSCREWRAGGVA